MGLSKTLRKKSFLVNALVGAVMGFVVNLLIGFMGLEVFNFFFIPLYRLIPISSIVVVSLIFFGAFGGILFKASENRKKYPIHFWLSLLIMVFLVIQILFKIV